MTDKKVSIIIPAYNEEKNIQKTIERFKNQKYFPMEVIVAVNGSSDRTYEIAEKYADKALNIKESGVCNARNEGVKIADGEVFIFSDADSYLSPDAVEKIAKAVDKNIIGTCFGKGDVFSWKGSLFFLLKNAIHFLRIYKGVIDGIIFCHRDIFFKINGFDKNLKIAEFKVFIKEALKNGAKYKVLATCRAITSMRRYEEKGYLSGVFFWLKWKIASLFGQSGDMEKKYFNIKK